MINQSEFFFQVLNNLYYLHDILAAWNAITLTGAEWWAMLKNITVCYQTLCVQMRHDRMTWTYNFNKQLLFVHGFSVLTVVNTLMSINI